MIYINISKNGNLITLDCHKGSENGEAFTIIIDAETKEIIDRSHVSDIDASVAFGHVYSMLLNNKSLPEKTVAAWG